MDHLRTGAPTRRVNQDVDSDRHVATSRAADSLPTHRIFGKSEPAARTSETGENRPIGDQ
jgi:hypothetical protein